MRACSPTLLWLLCALGCAGAPQPPPATPTAAPITPALAAEDAPSEPAPQAPEAHSRPPTDAESERVWQLAQEAARLRGLPFLRTVDVEVRDAAAMKQFVHEQLEDEPLELIRQRYALLGLLKPDLDIWSLYLDVMEEQLMGYYDPERGSLTIREDVAVRLTAADTAGDSLDAITLSGIVFHELVHALQDQHFDLSRLESDALSNDEVMALQALVEGDATVATFAYYAEQTGTPLEVLLERSAASMREQVTPIGGDSKLASAPPILRETLLFPYREGSLFVRDLLRSGGWKAVDNAHQHPPPSTGHVLWPRRQLSGVKVVPLRDAFANSDFETLEDEVLGPYETGLFLAEHGGEPAWAKHWTSDRLWQVRIEGQPALAWQIELNDVATARQVEASLAQLPEFAVTRSGRRVMVLSRVPESLVEPLFTALAG